MKQTTTAKIQIKVSPEEHQNLHNTMQVYTDACNCVSEYIYDTHNLKQRELNKALYGKLRADFELGAQMAQSVMITVISKYKTIIKNQKEWIKPVFRKPQIDLVWNRDYSLVNNRSLFSVNTLTGRIKCEFYDKGFESYFDVANKFGTAKLVCRHNKFFLHIPITYEIDMLDTKDVSNVVGIDRGVRFLATSYASSGKTIFYSGGILELCRRKGAGTQMETLKVQYTDGKGQFRMVEDTVFWSCQCHNTFDREFDYGKRGWMSERFCHSQGLLTEHYPDGSVASTWFALMPWACGSILEGLNSML